METILIEEHFDTIKKCSAWANELVLVGNFVPGFGDNYIVFRVEQFQIIMHNGESYTIIVLVKVQYAG